MVGQVLVYRCAAVHSPEFILSVTNDPGPKITPDCPVAQECAKENQQAYEQIVTGMFLWHTAGEEMASHPLIVRYFCRTDLLL